MMHRLTIHRTNDNPDLTMDFDVPDGTPDDLLKGLLTYDLNDPVFTLIVKDVDPDKQYRGIAVAVHEIDYLCLGPTV